MTDKAFQELKSILTSKPVLKYYDVNKPVVLSVDASQDGLGSVLLQENLPVAYASRALTQTERNYAQIEKEALAISFACNRFRKYIAGKEVEVESDHKPLEAIFKKPLSECPIRLQRVRMKLQAFDINVKYKPGKELLLADALSRAYLKNSDENCEDELNAEVFMLLDNFPISMDKKEAFKNEVVNDEEMQMLEKFIKKGWPSDKTNVPDVIQPYFTCSDELTMIDGLIFKAQRLVVPKKFRKEMLDRIHYSHLGIEKCKNRAREVVFWPNMNKQIEDVVKNCESCMIYKRANVKEPMKPHEIPNGPWEVLGMDLFYFRNAEWLLVIDYFSKYVEVAKLDNVYGVTIVAKLKSIFARFGIPQIIYSDNGSHFNNANMKNFATSWNFKHLTSSPNYPQSNGMAERNIGTIKNMFKKIENGNQDPNLALLEYRNTPISNEIKSPNQLLLGLKTRGLLPFSIEKECQLKNMEVKTKLQERQNVQKYNYDKSAHKLEPLNVHDQVFVRKEKNKPLVSGKVTDYCNRPRSYEVELDNGKKFERNRVHLYKTPRKVNNDEKIEILPNQINNEENQSNSKVETSTKESSVNCESINPSIVNNSPKLIVTRSGRTVQPPSYLQIM